MCAGGGGVSDGLGKSHSSMSKNNALKSPEVKPHESLPTLDTQILSCGGQCSRHSCVSLAFVVMAGLQLALLFKKLF